MRLRQVAVAVIFALILLAIHAFQYRVEINKENGDRNVFCGIPGIFTTAYIDKAVTPAIRSPFKGISTEKEFALDKVMAMVLVGAVGILLILSLK